MDIMDEKKMVTLSVEDGPWTGCAVLFLRSCPAVNLLSLYKDQQGKFSVFKVLKLTLTDSAGGLEGYEILKLHDADPLLGVEVKFVDVAACRRFLQCYGSGAVQQSLSQHACRLLHGPQELVLETQLKAGTHTLDFCLDDLELCLQHIHQSQPGRLRDDEIAELDQQLQSQALGHIPQPPTLSQEEPPVPSNCFLFQKRVFEDRILAAGDLQRFSNGVGRDWRKVGRALGKNCRALKGPAIDNLAYEYEREGLYEQAYQLLSRFIQAEGSAARLGRLVRALEDSKLTSLAENILDIQPRE
ncbi:tumor necrosis factor receptor type 1-associated DEATH domain protein [Salmo salar]|uniref:Tumor necrosis factor receptor type 1-associated DEATH domain protein n=1 Tax=Salmo salar TaxID=8030 RepID=A0A1S3KUZ1_SALSA|nr:tumor necrosis factor receptor type 1-associated DEATH domain protein-like [Salmo salar]XP_013982431.1 tumor necrosis factor receptor type 1-associated DEATH domain protein-like [Salmo salar]XP_013982432.1 tumor necrosis factor receptor type 1-associated DEATH domain protein-like [Salmo salar]XP_013982433.1 tumor necrosis factor receptor type 1-associated DEATH domain protein-like [Salmo salar]|eukprot:XP_013982430.1 PREDICTED: tumor necrosis factor receptor type 1-associated DEATH domain protein-like [Salmo salar]